MGAGRGGNIRYIVVILPQRPHYGFRLKLGFKNAPSPESTLFNGIFLNASIVGIGDVPGLGSDACESTDDRLAKGLLHVADLTSPRISGSTVSQDSASSPGYKENGEGGKSAGLGIAWSDIPLVFKISARSYAAVAARGVCWALVGIGGKYGL